MFKQTNELTMINNFHNCQSAMKLIPLSYAMHVHVGSDARSRLVHTISYFWKSYGPIDSTKGQIFESYIVYNHMAGHFDHKVLWE